MIKMIIITQIADVRRTLLYLLLASIVCFTVFATPETIRKCHAANQKTATVNINIYDSVMLNKQDYIMVGERGEIYLTKDSGITWQHVRSDTEHNIFSVSFTENQYGWASGALGTIVHTSDCGRSWIQQKSGSDKHLFAIDFYDRSYGCAVGDWGTILRTMDGGVTWEDHSLSEDIILYDVYLSDGKRGWAVGEFGQIFYTSDSGKTWTKLQSPVFESLFTISGDDVCLYAAGLDGVIIYSHDKGETWERGNNLLRKSIYGIDVADNVGWAVGEEGTVLHSNDRGQNWQPVEVPIHARLFWFGAISIKANSAPKGFAAGAHGIMFRIKNNKLVWD